jgi:hypothetical protein
MAPKSLPSDGPIGDNRRTCPRGDVYEPGVTRVAAPTSSSSGLRDVHPMDADLPGGVPNLSKVIAVGHHPVRISRLLDQLLPAAMDLNVLLGAADVERRVPFDRPLEPDPTAELYPGSMNVTSWPTAISTLGAAPESDS